MSALSIPESERAVMRRRLDGAGGCLLEPGWDSGKSPHYAFDCNKRFAASNAPSANLKRSNACAFAFSLYSLGAFPY
ncbi:hypothetical protein H6A60_10170 [Sutterella massiliensis]|uniref:Uncharacterized protein n=1 Tax=Sutterella massiliensis TaxID=1816689 RepID=A0ABS2DU68_9BURK|nr:hypothetical protein [Sutterella massiliensis]MBM6704844.1 hypothetical protein [Sutterella massiliensis]